LEDAKKAFKEKFLEKTGNDWANREHFVRYTDRYSWQMRYYRKKEQEEKKDQLVESSLLDQRVQQLLRTITDEKTLNKDLSNFNLDLARLPVGQFSVKQVHDGFQLLSEIAKVAGQLSYVAGYRGRRQKEAAARRESEQLQTRLAELNSRFYEVVPHDFGERRPKLIASAEDVRSKFDMLQVMADVTEAMGCVEEDLLKEARQQGKSREDVVYEGLGAELVPVEAGSAYDELVRAYIRRTSDRDNVAVRNIFRVRRFEEVEAFAQFVGGGGGGAAVVEDNEGARPSNLLLWHGSRVSNMAGILSRGLQIAPPEAPQTGLMFGKGVYFADTFAKSANYTGWTDVRYMLLCEVAVGRSACLTTERYMERPITGTDSTKGVGQMTPARDEWLVLAPTTTTVGGGGGGESSVDDGDVAVGLPAANVRQLAAGASGGGVVVLRRNEYIVYDPARIRVRFVVEFEL
ncbi:hypothetical protein HK405_006143, partial [Cladochytrium tenue]